jgi:hypothetical protein
MVEQLAGSETANPDVIAAVVVMTLIYLKMALDTLGGD